MSIVYPRQAAELIELLAKDQNEYKPVAKLYIEGKQHTVEYKVARKALLARFLKRADRGLEILAEIGLPSLSNIGSEGAQALSILVSHSPSRKRLQHVLDAFNICYEQDRDDTYFKSIPAMTDWLAITQHKAQRFGTIWLFDNSGYPYLPTVEDFPTINKRRAAYGIEPLHWPKSLAIPADDQPWLKQPLSSKVMRMPSAKEYQEIADELVD